jgi:hypothetical protein
MANEEVEGFLSSRSRISGGCGQRLPSRSSKTMPAVLDTAGDCAIAGAAAETIRTTAETLKTARREQIARGLEV